MEAIVIEFEIDDAQMISVNDQYIHPVRKTKNGKYFSYFAPSNELKEVQEFYEEKLKEAISDEQLELLKELVPENDKDIGLSLQIVIGVPTERSQRKRSFYEIDVSNYIKALEDCIVNRTGIDDSRHFKVISEKHKYYPKDDRYRWIVYIKIQPYEAKPYINFDNK